MKKLLLSVALAVGLTAMASAEVGIGASFSNENYDYDANGDYSYGSNTFRFTLAGAIGLSNGVEIDPYLSYYAVTENDAVDESNEYTDDYDYSVTTVGTDVFFTRSIGEDFRILGGLGGSVGFGSLDYPDLEADYSRLAIQIYVPVAAEVKLLPSLGLRVGAKLASFGSFTETYAYPDYDEEYVNQWTNIALVPSGLSFGAFLYF